MKCFVVCPYCGNDLLKAEDGSYVEISCSKCSKDLVVEVKDRIITIKNQVIETLK